MITEKLIDGLVAAKGLHQGLGMAGVNLCSFS